MPRPINLKCGTHTRFAKSFIVDPECLARIASIVERSAKLLTQPTAVVFHVNRKDERFFETQSLQEVLEDPNVDGQELRIVALELRDTDPARIPEPWAYDWMVRLTFDYTSSDQVALEIYHDNKSWALLLADELQPQIERTLKCDRLSSWVLVPLFASVGILGVALAERLRLVSMSYDQWHAIPEGFTAAGLVLLTIGLCWLSVQTIRRQRLWAIRLFGAESVFLWGDQERSYRAREQLRSRLQGAVLVGFFLSLLTNAIVALLMS